MDAKPKKIFWGLIGGLVLFAGLMILDFYRCPFAYLTGYPCVGCGLSHGFLAILRLDFASANAFNALSIPLFIAFCALGLITISDMIFRTQYLMWISEVRLTRMQTVLVGALFVLNWSLNLLRFLNRG